MMTTRARASDASSAATPRKRSGSGEARRGRSARGNGWSSWRENGGSAPLRRASSRSQARSGLVVLFLLALFLLFQIVVVLVLVVVLLVLVLVVVAQIVWIPLAVVARVAARRSRHSVLVRHTLPDHVPTPQKAVGARPDLRPKTASGN